MRSFKIRSNAEDPYVIRKEGIALKAFPLSLYISSDDRNPELRLEGEKFTKFRISSFRATVKEEATAFRFSRTFNEVSIR